MKKNVNKKPILARGEKYTIPNSPVGNPPGDTPNPYPYPMAKKRVYNKLHSLIKHSDDVPLEAMPDDVIVSKLILHPSFLAKSYYPNKIFDEYELTSIGSKEVFVSPEVPVNNEQHERAVSSSLYFVSGKKTSYQKLLNDIENNVLNKELEVEVGRIEDISFFYGNDKISKSIKKTTGYTIYEVVLHSAFSEEKVISLFSLFINKINGAVLENKTRVVGGLIFCFVKIDAEKIKKLAEFSFVRVVRPVADIKLSDSLDISRTDELIKDFNGFQKADVTKESPTVAIFDGGVIINNMLGHNMRYFDLTGSNDGNSEIFNHGELVSSAIMYGQVHDILASDHVVVPVDHYKVFCEEDTRDIALVNVIDRIEAVLQSKKYKIVNISLGPNVPRPDDEPSLWTAKLDKLAADGDVLIVVAAGNGGLAVELDDGEDLARIQPPADMLNGISIGSADSMGVKWNKATYSSIGPGRRPGYVKPDALFFGGEIDDSAEKIKLIDLDDYSEQSVYGTSFAAPLVTRLAAIIDQKTLGKLTVPSLRALLIHSADISKMDKKLCGWGRISNNIDDILFCDDDSVTLIYQGVLNKSGGVRAAIPCPKSLSDIQAKIALKATLCFYTDVDQNHTVSYSRCGIGVTFRPHNERFDFNKKLGRFSSEASTRGLFTKKKIFGNEQTLRRDAHKWETCYRVTDSMYVSSVQYPSIDIVYLTRDEGHPLTAKEMKNLKPLAYSLILTVSIDKEFGLYNKILDEYELLTPIELQTNIEDEVLV